MKSFLKTNFLLILILGLALFFRFWQINHLPDGLFPDEAANGLDVNSILHGDLRPFYERGNGREALFFYVIAAVVNFFGRGPWQHHVVSAAFGFFEVLATYFLTKRMFGKKPALFAAFFMAVASYAVTISRTAFRANTLPLFTTLTLLFLIKFFQDRTKKAKSRAAIFAGIFFALGFYTYIAYRVMLGLFLFFTVIILFANRGQILKTIRGHLTYISQFTLAFLIFIFPIARYFYSHPDEFAGRAGNVSIFSKDLNHGDILGTLLQVSKATILSFFTVGDSNWRHNVSGFPFLSPLISPFFAAALIVFTVSVFTLLVQAYRKKIEKKTAYQALVAFWFWIMLLPEITTAEGIPHGLRLIGVIPAIFILAGWTFYTLWEHLRRNYRLAIPGVLLLGSFLGAYLIYNYYLYFQVAAKSPDYYYAFRSDLTTVSRYLNQRNFKNKTFLSLDKFSVQTVDYFTTETSQPYILVDPASTFQVKLSAGDEVVFTMSTLYDRIKFMQYHPEAKLVRIERNKFGEIIMLVYEK